jgi:hypothetical protein
MDGLDCTHNLQRLFSDLAMVRVRRIRKGFFPELA